MALIRHSRETFSILFKWYASCAAAGVAALFVIVGVLRLSGLSLSASNVDIGLLVAAPFFLVALIIAWRKVEPYYKSRQIKAMMTTNSGLNALEELRRRKVKD